MATTKSRSKRSGASQPSLIDSTLANGCMFKLPDGSTLKVVQDTWLMVEREKGETSVKAEFDRDSLRMENVGLSHQGSSLAFWPHAGSFNGPLMALENHINLPVVGPAPEKDAVGFAKAVLEHAKELAPRGPVTSK